MLVSKMIAYAVASFSSFVAAYEVFNVLRNDADDEDMSIFLTSMAALIISIIVLFA